MNHIIDLNKRKIIMKRGLTVFVFRHNEIFVMILMNLKKNQVIVS